MKELEEIGEDLRDFIESDIENNAGLVLLSDKQRTMSFGMGKRSKIINLFCEIFSQDKEDFLIDCIKESLERLNGQETMIPMVIKKNSIKS